MIEKNSEKTIVIKAKTKALEFNFSELWNFRELIFLFVKRNYVTRYKQTILGPLWLFLSPLISTLLYSIIFTNVAQLPTDGVNSLAFYLSGNILWSCFASCINQTSNTFLTNAGILGKVYFPRLVMPISATITAICDFVLQLFLLIGLMIILIINGNSFDCNGWILAVPIIIIQYALIGLGCGIIVSSLTTKYRDLMVLVSFGVQLWMYASPVVYSYSLIPESYRFIYNLNPVTPGLLMFRNALFGVGDVPLVSWGISWLETIVLLFVGIMIFNRVEKTFMDTV